MLQVQCNGCRGAKGVSYDAEFSAKMAAKHGRPAANDPVQLNFHLDGAMETPQGGFSHLEDYGKAKSILEHYLRRRIVRGSGRKMRTEEDRRWFRCAFVKDC